MAVRLRADPDVDIGRGDGELADAFQNTLVRDRLAGRADIAEAVPIRVPGDPAPAAVDIDETDRLGGIARVDDITFLGIVQDQ